MAAIDLHVLQSYTTRWYAHQKYGNEPYDVHIAEGEAVLDRFGFSEQSNPDLYAAFKLHDVFEDNASIKPSDVLAVYVRHGWTRESDPWQVASIRWAMRLTDEPGETRTERKKRTYPKIVEENEAVILKLADRIANTERPGKLQMYTAEYPSFRDALYRTGTLAQSMWDYLDSIMGWTAKLAEESSGWQGHPA